MTGRPKALLAILVCAVATCIFAQGALAGDPPYPFSTIDAVVVGSPLGQPTGGAPAGYDVTVRDGSNAPVAGVVVTLRFPAGMRLYAGQNAGTTIDCSQSAIHRLTDAQGHVNFAARVGGSSDVNAIEVSADGVVLGLVKGRSPDLDADGKAGLSDFVLFADNFLHQPAVQTTDFDLNGNTGLGDFTILSREFLAPGGPQALCP